MENFKDNSCELTQYFMRLKKNLLTSSGLKVLKSQVSLHFLWRNVLIVTGKLPARKMKTTIVFFQEQLCAKSHGVQFSLGFFFNFFKRTKFELKGKCLELCLIFVHLLGFTVLFVVGIVKILIISLLSQSLVLCSSQHYYFIESMMLLSFRCHFTYYVRHITQYI